MKESAIQEQMKKKKWYGSYYTHDEAEQYFINSDWPFNDYFSALTYGSGTYNKCQKLIRVANLQTSDTFLLSLDDADILT